MEQDTYNQQGTHKSEPTVTLTISIRILCFDNFAVSDEKF